jgi:hypothetical protein
VSLCLEYEGVLHPEARAERGGPRPPGALAGSLAAGSLAAGSASRNRCAVIVAPSTNSKLNALIRNEYLRPHILRVH